MKHTLFIFLAIISIFTTSSFAKSNSATSEKSREKLIGNIIKNALETYHYRSLRIEDEVSKKAFKEFLKRYDFGKQFFLKSDVKAISKYKSSMDDQMKSGEHKLLDLVVKKMKVRIDRAEAVRKKVFKGTFKFTGKEKLELDPKKRSYSRTEKQFAAHWRKVFKHAVLNRYLSYLDGEKEDKKSKKKDKKKDKKKKKHAEKKLTDKEMRKKAHDAVSKKYTRYFKRLKKEDRTDQLEKFFNSLANIYDPHTNYLPPKRKEDFDIDISGSLEGIGAVLQEDGPYIKVVKIVPGGAAWSQKDLEVDDIILMVAQGPKEPVDLVDMRVDDAVRYIRGKKGTEVRLTVKKTDGTRKVISIIRDVVEIGASFAKSSIIQHKELGKKFGYILVPKFYRDFNVSNKNCTEDVRMELKRLKSKNVDGVILDLRNNGGGALEDAKQMSGLFIKKGPIVQVKSHTGQIDVLRDNDSSVLYDGPLIVMINRFSASASEILAGAMQDYKRAVIVGGEYSHGKGTVQAVLDLNQGPLRSLFGPTMGALKVTIQKFYRVTGKSTQFKGVTPDIILPDPLGYTESREQDLEYALKFDLVPKKAYEPWKNASYNLGVLKQRSGKRVDKDERFQKIKKSVKYLVELRKNTNVSLNLKSVLAEEKKNKAITEKLKLDKENDEITISNFEASLKAHENVKAGDDKKWKTDFKIRKEEWVKQLRKDPLLEETLFIMDDMIQANRGKKLSMVK